MEAVLDPSVKASDIQLKLHGNYLETVEWLAEIEFYKTELRLLSKLLDKAFHRFHKRKEYTDLLKLDKRLKVFLFYSIKEMQQRIEDHERGFVLLDQNIFSQDDKLILERHTEFDQAMSKFKDERKKLKTELLKFSEAEWKSASNRNVCL